MQVTPWTRRRARQGKHTMETTPFKPFRVTRTTGETEFAIDVAPHRTGTALLELPNRMLAHLLDHFVRGAGMGITVARTEWPRSWEFDHVLCEDVGQLVGRAVAAIAEERTASAGIPRPGDRGKRDGRRGQQGQCYAGSPPALPLGYPTSRAPGRLRGQLVRARRRPGGSVPGHQPATVSRRVRVR
jgi:hypothetical protein